MHNKITSNISIFACKWPSKIIDWNKIKIEVTNIRKEKIEKEKRHSTAAEEKNTLGTPRLNDGKIEIKIKSEFCKSHTPKQKYAKINRSIYHWNEFGIRKDPQQSRNTIACILYGNFLHRPIILLLLLFVQCDNKLK